MPVPQAWPGGSESRLLGGPARVDSESESRLRGHESDSDLDSDGRDSDSESGSGLMPEAAVGTGNIQLGPATAASVRKGR